MNKPYYWKVAIPRQEHRLYSHSDLHLGTIRVAERCPGNYWTMHYGNYAPSGVFRGEAIADMEMHGWRNARKYLMKNEFIKLLLDECVRQGAYHG